MADVKLHLGDCLEYMKGMADKSVDAVITDPPYSSGTRKEASKSLRGSMLRSEREWITTDNLSTNGFMWFMRQLSVLAKNVTKPGGHFLSFIDWRMFSNLSGAIESADWRTMGCIVWNKTFFGMGTYFRNQHEFIVHFANGGTPKAFRHDVANVLSYPPIRNGNHPTEKPIEMLVDLITTVSPPGATILDPFMGSGSTGVACVKTGRNFIGCEINPDYFAIAERRIKEAQAQMTMNFNNTEAQWTAS